MEIVMSVIAIILVIIVGIIWLIMKSLVVMNNKITALPENPLYAEKRKIIKKINKINKLSDDKKIDKEDEIKNLSLELEKLNVKEDNMKKTLIEDKDISTTQKLLEFVDNLITIEIANRLAKLEALDKSYEILTLDADVQEISKNVLQGLNTDVFEMTLLIKNEYLVSYIVSRATTILISMRK